jgi:hypothetical protein
MELKEGNELLPGSLPGRDQPGVLLAPVVLTKEFISRSTLVV